MNACTVLVSLLIIQAAESDKGNDHTPKLTSDILATVKRIDSTWDESSARDPKVTECIQGVIFREHPNGHYDTVWAHAVLENLYK